MKILLIFPAIIALSLAHHPLSDEVNYFCYYNNLRLNQIIRIIFHLVHKRNQSEGDDMEGRKKFS